jgi:uncharacterized protein (TIGR03437 family)
VDGIINSAANPIHIDGYISIFTTGEGQTAPPGVTVDGIPATIQHAGRVQGQVARLLQVNVKIPDGVQAGGSVPVVLQVGDASTTPGAVWIAVAGK